MRRRSLVAVAVLSAGVMVSSLMFAKVAWRDQGPSGLSLGLLFGAFWAAALTLAAVTVMGLEKWVENAPPARKAWRKWLAAARRAIVSIVGKGWVSVRAGVAKSCRWAGATVRVGIRSLRTAFVRGEDGRRPGIEALKHWRRAALEAALGIPPEDVEGHGTLADARRPRRRSTSGSARHDRASGGPGTTVGAHRPVRRDPARPSAVRLARGFGEVVPRDVSVSQQPHTTGVTSSDSGAEDADA